MFLRRIDSAGASEFCKEKVEGDRAFSWTVGGLTAIPCEGWVEVGIQLGKLFARTGMLPAGGCPDSKEGFESSLGPKNGPE